MSNVYICSPHYLSEINHKIARAVIDSGNRAYLPADLAKTRIPPMKSSEIRDICIQAIDDSDYFVIYLDEYGMDSSWELGYAYGSGKKIIGISFDENKLVSPKSRAAKTIWDHWMHGWKTKKVISNLSDLDSLIKSEIVYLVGPSSHKTEIDGIEKAIKHLARKVFTPTNVISEDEQKQSKQYWYKFRPMYIEAILSATIVVAYVDYYGMDSAWELGFAEKAGKQIVGVSLNPANLNKPQPLSRQSTWEQWMHGWHSSTIVHNSDDLIRLLSRKPEETQDTVVCAIIENRIGDEIQVLVQTRHNPDDDKYKGFIEIPGGKIRKNETVVEALKRETLEETGLLVDPIDQVSSGKYVADGSKSNLVHVFSLAEETGHHSYIGIFLRCKVSGGKLRNTSEAVSQRWISLDELRSFITDHKVLPINAPGLLAYFEEMSIKITADA